MFKFFKAFRNEFTETTAEKQGRLTLLIIGSFIFLNAVKIALFNVILLGDTVKLSDFTYKIVLSLSVAFIYTLIILKLNNKWFFLITYVFQSAYLFANLSYYIYYRSYLHILQWVSLLGEGFTVARNFMVPISFEMLIIAIDLPIFIYLFVKFKNMLKIRKIVSLPALSLLIIALITFGAAELSYDSNKTLVERTEPAAVNTETVSVKRYGTIVNEVMNMFTNSSDEERASKIKFGKEISAEKTKDDSPNIIYIQVESMDANIVHTKYNGEYIMPYLAELSQNCVYYPYTLSYHMGGGTSDSEFSGINSVEAISGFPALKLESFDFSNSFVKKLKDGGYTTLAFHGNEAKFFSRGEVYPKLGYDNFYDIKALGLKESGWGASDGDLFNSTYNILKEQKEPFFAHIITMSSHEPFTNVYKCQNLAYEFDDVQEKQVRNYFTSMRYVDSQIEKFVKEVSKLDDNTYIMIYGDHMSSIKDDEYSICGYMYENKLFEFVPVLIITPDKQVYTETNAVACFKDFSPTVLNMSGIKYTVKTDGTDLLKFGGLSGEVSLKGSMYDRSEIYNKVKENDEKVTVDN